MKTFRKMVAVAALATLAVGGSGCLWSRSLKSVIQSGDKNVTVIQTVDTYGIWFFQIFPTSIRHQFWKCSEQPGAISCKKSCTEKGVDLDCPDLMLPGSPATISGGSVGNSVN